MKEIKLEAPVFIIFSEYLGYVSPFTNLAEEWCDGKIPPIHMQKVIMVEAKCILRQMRKDYTKRKSLISIMTMMNSFLKITKRN